MKRYVTYFEKSEINHVKSIARTYKKQSQKLTSQTLNKIDKVQH